MQISCLTFSFSFNKYLPPNSLELCAGLISCIYRFVHLFDINHHLLWIRHHASCWILSWSWESLMVSAFSYSFIHSTHSAFYGRQDSPVTALMGLKVWWEKKDNYLGSSLLTSAMGVCDVMVYKGDLASEGGSQAQGLELALSPSFFVFLFFQDIFIYLREREWGGGGAQGERESQAVSPLSTEPDVVLYTGLHPQSWDHDLSLNPETLNQLGSQAPCHYPKLCC